MSGAVRADEENERLLLNGIAAMTGILFDAMLVLAALEEHAKVHFPEYAARIRAVQQHISDSAGTLADVCADNRRANGDRTQIGRSRPEWN